MGLVHVSQTSQNTVNHPFELTVLTVHKIKGMFTFWTSHIVSVSSRPDLASSSKDTITHYQVIGRSVIYLRALVVARSNKTKMHLHSYLSQAAQSPHCLQISVRNGARSPSWNSAFGEECCLTTASKAELAVGTTLMLIIYLILLKRNYLEYCIVLVCWSRRALLLPNSALVLTEIKAVIGRIYITFLCYYGAQAQKVL